ncbi:MAG: hypothetical protein V3575_01355 [Candidatus Absconditabacteria bacterium]
MATKSQAIKTGMLQGLGFSLIVSIFILGVFFAKAARTNTNPTSGQGDPTNLYSNGDDTLTSAKWNALVEKVENNIGSNGQFGNIITTYAKNTIYQATEDGFVLGYCNGSGYIKSIQSTNSDLSNPITSWESEDSASGASRERIISPIKKNNYRKIEVLGGCTSLQIRYFPMN